MKKLIVLAFILISIGVNAQTIVKSVPGWYKNPPKSTKKYFAVGSGTSQSLDIANSKARLDANTSLAEQCGEVKVEVNEKGESGNYTKNITSKESDKKRRRGRYSVEILSEENESEKEQTLTHKKTVIAKLENVRIVKKAVMQKGSNYTVFILVEMKKSK